ncbi:formimidoylglutamase [Dyella subtropica]|uniref:formimidoylglutamase n=1 Tax=Dyella subtropica TaxID=2992127 RepID=UPI0022540CA3|nr:formimidoylglutamase [Dyella subtropica]
MTIEWQGRIDSLEDSAAFRWHQRVRPVVPHAPSGIALIGFASDEGVRRNGGRTGAAEGPDALRRALCNLPVIGDTPIYDAGDEGCADGDLERSQLRYADRVSALIDDGHLPVGLGGGHEIAFASYLGLVRSERCRGQRIAIVNLDAHLDLRDNPVSNSGTPFLQAIRHADAHGIELRYFCLGVSRSANTQRLFATAQSTGSWYWLDEDLAAIRMAAVLAELKEQLDMVDAIYLTVCMDVLPEAVAPGVSAPAARGVGVDVVELIAKAIAQTGKLRMFDVAELCPRLDPVGATARVAARLIHGVTTAHS